MECFICGKETHREPGRKSKNVVCSDECLRARRKQVGLEIAKAGKAVPPPSTPESRAAASKRMTGAGCPKWNGGKMLTSSGYMLVLAPSDYPYPNGVNARGYIREHRMVMELHLGRALSKSEIVHHKNGNKLDNRVENLEVHSSHSEHLAHHGEEGLWDNRWPKCIMGCGRQSKPFGGYRWLACARCRQLTVNKGNPTAQQKEDWPPSSQ